MPIDKVGLYYLLSNEIVVLHFKTVMYSVKWYKHNKFHITISTSDSLEIDKTYKDTPTVTEGPVIFEWMSNVKEKGQNLE